jgi:hypothetical protein
MKSFIICNTYKMYNKGVKSRAVGLLADLTGTDGTRNAYMFCLECLKGRAHFGVKEKGGPTILNKTT